MKPPVSPHTGRLIQITNKTKIQTQSSVDRITTSLRLAHQRKSKKKKKNLKLNINLILYKADTNHYTNLGGVGRVKPKGRKNSTLEPGKRRPQTQ